MSNSFELRLNNIYLTAFRQSFGFMISNCGKIELINIVQYVHQRKRSY